MIDYSSSLMKLIIFCFYFLFRRLTPIESCLSFVFSDELGRRVYDLLSVFKIFVLWSQPFCVNLV